MSELALPEGWAEALFTDCIEILDNQRKPINNTERQSRILGKDESELYPYYGATGQAGWIDGYLFNEELIALGEDGVPFLDISKHKAYMLRGKTWVNNHAHVLKAVEGVALNKYLLHFFNSIDYLGYVNGGTRLKLTQINMKKIPVILPSLNEQKEIVILLNTHLTTVSQIQARLDAIPKIIENFRQSVLNDAVTGKLTEEWRKDKRYETLDSYEIPASWTVLSIEEVADVKGGKRLPKGEKLVEFDTGYPYIRAGQLKLGTVVNTEEARSSQKYLLAETQKQIESYIVKENDAYITIVGASIGDAGLIPKSSDGANLTENAAKLTNYKKELNPVFLSFWLRSVWIQHEIKLQTKSAAQGKLALHRIKSLPFVYPTYEEQNKIVQSVEQFLAHADQIEKSVATAKARVDNLTQSILHQAFTGNLTAEWREQNPDLISGENCAEALLAKIKSEKQGISKKKSGKG